MYGRSSYTEDSADLTCTTVIPLFVRESIVSCRPYHQMRGRQGQKEAVGSEEASNLEQCFLQDHSTYTSHSAEEAGLPSSKPRGQDRSRL